MSHTITDMIDGKTITNEEFYKQAVRWASMVRNMAKRNTLQFTKGKKHTSITKKSGKVERRLRDSIQYNIEHPSHIPEAVSFKIPIHGIWREWAVGYGQLFTSDTTIPINPTEWGEKHSDYESALVAIYGPLRGEELPNVKHPMTDAVRRYNNLKTKL